MEIILTYNAQSGLKNAILDSFHKIFSPSTYPCDLCALTYGHFSENSHWKKFRMRSNIQISFYHIDEFEAKFGKLNYRYPVALLHQNKTFDTLISPEEFKQLKNTEELIARVETTIKDILNSKTTS
jgi:hypothetical protein